MRTIDEIIEREEQEAKRLEDEVARGAAYHFKLGTCAIMNKVDDSKENTEKAMEHRQIAKWLKEYKELCKPSGTYECFHCGHKSVIWGADFDFSDYGYDGEGIVHSCTCANCGADIEYRIRTDNPEEE